MLLADRLTAQRLVAEAGSPGGIGRLAARESLDEGSRARRGDLGWVERGQLAGPLEDAIFAAPVGRVVGPWAVPSGGTWSWWGRFARAG